MTWPWGDRDVSRVVLHGFYHRPNVTDSIEYVRDSVWRKLSHADVKIISTSLFTWVSFTTRLSNQWHQISPEDGTDCWCCLSTESTVLIRVFHLHHALNVCWGLIGVGKIPGILHPVWVSQPTTYQLTVRPSVCCYVPMIQTCDDVGKRDLTRFLRISIVPSRNVGDWSWSCATQPEPVPFPPRCFLLPPQF